MTSKKSLFTFALTMVISSVGFFDSAKAVTTLSTAEKLSVTAGSALSTAFLHKIIATKTMEGAIGKDFFPYIEIGAIDIIMRGLFFRKIFPKIFPSSSDLHYLEACFCTGLELTLLAKVIANTLQTGQKSLQDNFHLNLKEASPDVNKWIEDCNKASTKMANFFNLDDKSLSTLYLGLVPVFVLLLSKLGI